jgi:hypothetical protein
MCRCGRVEAGIRVEGTATLFWHVLSAAFEWAFRKCEWVYCGRGAWAVVREWLRIPHEWHEVHKLDVVWFFQDGTSARCVRSPGASSATHVRRPTAGGASARASFCCCGSGRGYARTACRS